MKEFISVIVAVAILAFLGCALAWFYSAIGVYAEMVSVARDIIVAVAASAGAYVAWRGVEEWKRQFDAKNEHELARRVLKAAYDLRNAIHSYRNMMMPNYEAISALSKLGEKIPDLNDTGAIIGVVARGGRGYVAAYRIRLQNMLEAAEMLRAEIIEVEIFWGEDKVNDILFPFLDLVFKIRNAHSAYFSAQDKERQGFSTSPELKQQTQKIIQGRSDDEIGKQATEFANSVRDWLLPKLKMQSRN